MKIKFNESKYNCNFYLEPETPQEVAQLLRITKSSKRQVPRISLNFNHDVPSLYINLNKISEEKQNNYINNDGK